MSLKYNVKIFHNVNPFSFHSSFRNFKCLIHETFLQDFSIHFKIKSVKKINIPRRIPKIFHDNL